MTDGYIEHLSGLVRLLDYQKFEGRPVFYSEDAVGHIFVEIKNGLVSNYVDCVIYRDDIDNEGNPILSKINFTSYLNYDLHAEVTVCLMELSRLGVFSKSISISTLMVEDGKRAIWVKNWSEDAQIVDEPIPKDVFKPGFSVNVPEAFIKILLLKMEETERLKGSFSRTWYLLKICLLYFLRGELTANRIYSIGYFSAQMHEKFRMEEDAIRAKKAEIFRQKGTLKNSFSAPQKRERKEAVIIGLRDEVIETHGLAAVRVGKLEAYHIHELAKIRKPPELIIKTTKKVIAENSIKNILSKLRKSGKID